MLRPQAIILEEWSGAIWSELHLDFKQDMELEVLLGELELLLNNVLNENSSQIVLAVPFHLTSCAPKSTWRKKDVERQNTQSVRLRKDKPLNVDVNKSWQPVKLQSDRGCNKRPKDNVNNRLLRRQQKLTVFDCSNTKRK